MGREQTKTAVPYRPPIRSPVEFTGRVPVSHDCMLDLTFPDVKSCAQKGRAARHPGFA